MALLVKLFCRPAADRRLLLHAALLHVAVIGATCLTRAVTAQALPRRAGGEASLHFGVAATTRSSLLEAHAWLERAGRHIVGGDVSAFHPLRHAEGNR